VLPKYMLTLLKNISVHSSEHNYTIERYWKSCLIAMCQPLLQQQFNACQERHSGCSRCACVRILFFFYCINLKNIECHIYIAMMHLAFQPLLQQQFNAWVMFNCHVLATLTVAIPCLSRTTLRLQPLCLYTYTILFLLYKSQKHRMSCHVMSI
jgi:hypothetical protein